MSYEWRSLRDVDTAAWSELVRVIADADETAEYYSAEDLAEELDEDGLELDRDTLGVYAGTQLVAFGQVRVRAAAVEGAARAILMGGVHPEHRGRGIGRDLLSRLEQSGRARAAAVHPDLDVTLSAEAGAKAASHQALLRHAGYAPVRYFFSMVRYLRPEDADLPVDPRVRPYRAEDDEDVRRVHADSFSTHWSFAPPGDQEWRQWYTGSRTFRPQLSVEIGDHGRLDGIVLGYQYEPHELWIGQVGVVPAARRQGLARAGLTTVIGLAARTGGFTEVGLGVDTENADGAGDLYGSVGFEVARTSIVFRKEE